MLKENFSSKEIETVNIRDQDKTILNKGLQRIYNYLKKTYKKNPEELPKVLIFPEASARLLVYVVKPLFDYFYRQCQLPQPKIIFVRTPQQGKEPTPREIDLLYERVEEVKNKLHLQEGDKILIIDDVCCEGTTFGFISESFNRTKPNLKIEGFFFIKYLNLPENCFYGIEELGLNFDFYLYGRDYIGVGKKKPKKYAQKVPGSEPQNISAIRKALAIIGDEFVKSLKEKSSP